MMLPQLVRPFRFYFLLLIAILLLTFPLAASGSSIFDIARAASPSVGDSSAAECNVPGDFSTIQGAVDDAGCTSITVGNGVFYENVIINRSLTIVGQGAADTTVGGSFSGSVFTIQPGGVVILTGLRIADGSGSGGNGGGVRNDGDLTINNSIISNNFATIGGGIFTTGTVTIDNSTISNNSASNGGGIYTDVTSTMTVNNSTISDNSVDLDGGGILTTGTVTIDNSIISNNSSSESSGGGVLNGNGGKLAISHSTFSNNSASSTGGGIYNYSGTINLNNSTISNNFANSGAGIGNSNGIVTIESSTISNNSASFDSGGGIINYSGTINLNNSTISDNSTVYKGGGIGNYEGTIIVDNSTISNNSATIGGGGIFNESSGTMNLSNSIVAYSATSDDCAGEITSQGFNLDSDNTCNLTATGDLPNHDPRLGPLQDNGGSTFTHALLSDSPAIDAGNCPGATSDQRGYARPVDIPDIPNVADGCDIGSYEIHDGNYYCYMPVVTRP